MSSSVRPGARIDDFLVGEHLHAGGMGDVFRVSGADGGRPLVMKVPRLETGSESLVSFETEATICPTLQGPHVASCVAVGELTRTPYLVFEQVEGETLEQRLTATPLPPHEVAAVGAAIADALASVHAQGVVHLDVKPANILLRNDGRAVLIDFGLAHHERFPDLLAEETRFAAGSAPYVSPEQLLGIRSDRRSDLFALGVVLYQLATGHFPFGEPDADTRNRFWLDPTPPSVLAADVLPWLQEVILRCLEPNAAQRYQTAAAVAFELRHPQQIALTERAKKASRAGLVAQAKRFFRARGELASRLEAPTPLRHATPVALVAVDTNHPDDELHEALRLATARLLAPSAEARLLCATVIPPSAAPLEHFVSLKRWAEPLKLPDERLALHVLEALSPADVVVELARYNDVDLVVLGAPSKGDRAWSASTASKVAAQVSCNVHLVRRPRR